MNPHQNSNQIPASNSAVLQQVNPVINQPMFNGNNMPVASPLCFMNFPTQPFQLQNTLPNGIGGFNPLLANQFNPSQAQFFAHSPMNPTAYHQNVGLSGQQVLLQNTIQNICQLLQLQNPNYTQCLPGNVPMFQNQIVNAMNPQNPVNHQFPMSSFNSPQNLVQGNLLSPGASGPVQIQQPQNHHATLTNSQGNHKIVPTNVNGAWVESQHKNFKGHKTYDASHKGSKSHKHVKEKFGIYKGNMRKAKGGDNLAADSVSQNSTNFEKKSKRKIRHCLMAPTKKPCYVASIVLQQLKEILAKQAELGCEVADIPASYLLGPNKQNRREKQHYKRGKFHNKRGTSFQDRIGKKARPNGQKPNHQPSLLQKLLTQDIKSDKNRLLQVLRFITANSFLTAESLRFPSVTVRETHVDGVATCSVYKAEEEEGEIID
ncbi:hypothetical protein E3N88_25403 [Mikania micrantha]|uniref:Uncharacterized protein n=1 Tax=Mikania micrantha TaxID=192012 RepID=A0A5N6N4M4_9ASTR|nr:hypothetical protein E3N88_25403 [Mikania micrantha]